MNNYRFNGDRVRDDSLPPEPLNHFFFFFFLNKCIPISSISENLSSQSQTLYIIPTQARSPKAPPVPRNPDSRQRSTYMKMIQATSMLQKYFQTSDKLKKA